MGELAERPSSIEVNRNAKGDYTFKVKIYFDETKFTPSDMAEATKNYMDEQLHKFNVPTSVKKG